MYITQKTNKDISLLKNYFTCQDTAKYHIILFSASLIQVF